MQQNGSDNDDGLKRDLWTTLKRHGTLVGAAVGCLLAVGVGLLLAPAVMATIAGASAAVAMGTATGVVPAIAGTACLSALAFVLPTVFGHSTSISQRREDEGLLERAASRQKARLSVGASLAQDPTVPKSGFGSNPVHVATTNGAGPSTHIPTTSTAADKPGW